MGTLQGGCWEFQILREAFENQKFMPTTLDFDGSENKISGNERLEAREIVVL